MKNSVLLASLWLGVLASGAFAAEVSVKGNINETVDASNNYFLSNSPSGYTVRPSSSIYLGALAATPTTRYALDSYYSYYKYFGPGAKDTSLAWGAPASEKFRIDHTTALSKYYFAASWDRSDAATAALQQTGTAIGRGTIDTFKVDGGVTRELTHTDSISWSAHGTTVSYTDPSQTPYFDYATNGAWTHRLSPTTTLTNSVNFDLFAADNPAHSQRLFWDIRTGLQSQLSNRLSFNGSIGMDFANAYQNGAVPSNIPTGASTFQQKVGAANSWVGDIALRYNLLPTTIVSLNATQAITPTIFGSLQKINSIGLSLNHDINHSANLAVLTQFSHIKSSETATVGATSSDVFTASARYGYKLTREWRTNLSYTYSQRNDQAGLVRSSMISFGLIRDFTLFGKPPEAVQKTPSELAHEDQMRAVQALPNLGPNFVPNLLPY